MDVDPTKASLKDDLERRRLAKLLTRGLEVETGFVLPIEHQSQGWVSSHWPQRADVITLIPGDSPMGFRLPLNSLPAVSEKERPQESDPFAPREPLPTYSPESYRSTQDSASAQVTQRQDTKHSESQKVIPTAICIEPRDGKLHLFLPPMTALEHYVSLLYHIERTAKALDLPVVIEGYEPPKDPRLQKFLITPDPGVIEVNIHPSSDWADLVEKTELLYREAHLSRLGTEKFMLDGRHTGTGGGNHITLGGPTPEDSPFLRKPDLLRSFVTYWQHHPGLSYLFSGMFIGPTSQAPRPDEGRDEALYEMEIAFQNFPEGLVDAPWLVDRLMRNLLVDVTGNTHRSEFCIDKMYAAGSAVVDKGYWSFAALKCHRTRTCLWCKCCCCVV